jgi:hypothetical protein
VVVVKELKEALLVLLLERQTLVAVEELVTPFLELVLQQQVDLE